MSELSFEQMLEESLKTIRTGEVVTGKVIDVKEDEIVLNIGYKSDGIITRSEYTNEPNVDLRNLVQVGDEMEAKVVKVNDARVRLHFPIRDWQPTEEIRDWKRPLRTMRFLLQRYPRFWTAA